MEDINGKRIGDLKMELQERLSKVAESDNKAVALDRLKNVLQTG